ncbi:hypothetical protein [Zavarzinia sp.]|uniref:hypothetical protein n=1 Tax=Zavarzinia sp. TaxID=2027920 RepID=UPI003BB7F359
MSKTIGIILQVAMIVVALATGQYYLAGALAVGLAGTLLTPTPKVDIPKPADGKILNTQPLPPRIFGYGMARLAGPVNLKETASRNLYLNVLLHEGRVDGFGDIYLHDEVVTIGTDGMGRPNAVMEPLHFQEYSDNIGGVFSFINISLRYGLVPEVAWPEAVAALDYWTEAHRGDGIAQLSMIVYRQSAERFQRTFPYGLPSPSVVTRMSLVFDPRDPGQTRADPDTWIWSQLTALNLADFLTHSRRMGFDWSRRIAPALDEWIAAVDVCAEQVPLKAGGTEDRYHFDGFFRMSDRRGDIIRAMLTTMDGWLYMRGDGAIGVEAGKYVEPSFVVPARHIINTQFRHNRRYEDRINEVKASYTSPAHDFDEVQAPAWRDEENISRLGTVRTSPLDLGHVQRLGQCRRLMKRAMARHKAPLRGVSTLDAYAVALRGKRYAKFDFSRRGYGILAVEITGFRLSLWPLGAVVEWVLADPDIDAWDPATEEGDPPPVPERETADERLTLPPPTIGEIASEAYRSSADTVAVRFLVSVVDAGDDDLAIELRYRELGGLAWRVEAVEATSRSGGFYVHATAPVSDGQTYEFQARYVNGGGVRGDWSPLVPPRSTANAAAPIVARRVTSGGARRVTSSGAERIA